MIKQRVKGLISNEMYVTLEKSINWDDRFIQVDFYYTNDYIRYHDIYIRIRCKGSMFYLQIITDLSQNSSPTSKEYKIPIPNVPHTISQGQLQQAFPGYDYGEVHMQGFFVTERFAKRIDEVQVMLDRNIYNNMVDFEVEMEYLSPNQIEQLIIDLNLLGKFHQAPCKYIRFFNTLWQV